MCEPVFNCIADTISNFIYYGRKEDEDLPLGSIQTYIENGDITLQEIKDAFCKELNKCLGENNG